MKLINGDFAIAHIGCGDGSAPLKTICSNGTTPGTLGGPSESSTFTEIAQWTNHCNSPGWAGLLMSTSASGPWSQTQNLAGPGISVDGGAGAWHGAVGLTNPSIWALDASEHRGPAGSVLYAYSTCCKNCALNPGHKHVGLALAEPVPGAPAGNYSLQDLTPKSPIFPWAAEDPCIWRDPDSGHYHILAHRTGDSWH